MKTLNFNLVVFLLSGFLLGFALRNFLTGILGHDFYLGALLITLLGSLLIGFLYNEGLKILSETSKWFLMASILGGLTSFSGFLLDISEFIQVGEFKSAFIFFTLMNMISICGCTLGYQISIGYQISNKQNS